MPLTRRDLMRGGALAAAGAPFLAACDSPDRGGVTVNGRAKVRLWTWYSEQRDEWPKLIREFEQSHPKIMIENRLFGDSDSYLPALQASVSAGDPPEIFAPHVLAIEYGKGGISVDLKKELGADFLADFFPSTNSEYTFGGKQYGLGWMAQTFGLFYDPEIFAKADVDAPQTWDDLLAIAPDIRSRAKVEPVAFSNNPGPSGLDFFLPLITQATDDPQVVLDLDQQVHGKSWDSAPVIEALQLVDKLQRAKVFAPGANGIKGDQAARMLYTGKAAMYFSGSWEPQGFVQSAPKEFVQRYRVMQTPAWAAGKRHWCANQAGAGLSVSAQSRNQEAALEFIRFLYEPARYTRTMNNSNSMPSTQSAGKRVANPVLKQMTSWLVKGNGAPHILFGKGSSDSASNALAALVAGQTSPKDAAATIQKGVEKAAER
ncbi:MAG TPA: extracellular solute-binding protein [Mycobacteriales bacterium]|nr:extracellular solute-binding protein [Mycobacteriales bacterium]